MYFPPQQKPAAAIFRLEVSKGGGEVRRDWMKEYMRGLTTEARLEMKKGMVTRLV